MSTCEWQASDRYRGDSHSKEQYIVKIDRDFQQISWIKSCQILYMLRFGVVYTKCSCHPPREGVD